VTGPIQPRSADEESFDTRPTDAPSWPEDEGSPATTPAPASPPPAAASPSIDRFLPWIAILAMVGTFVLIPGTFALTFIAAIWLIATRLGRRSTLLGLTLTQALAWSATIVIVEFLLALTLFVLGGNLGQ
jgi:hypothetical protein